MSKIKFDILWHRFLTPAGRGQTFALTIDGRKRGVFRTMSDCCAEILRFIEECGGKYGQQNL